MTPLRYAAAGVLVVLLGLLAVQTGRLQRAETAIQAERAGRAQDKATAAVAAASAVMAARAEEQRRTAAMQETVDVAQEQIAAARRDARAADGAADRLRQHVAALASRCGGPASDPAAAAGSAPAAGAGLVLADLFSRADERAGQLAEYADQARIAGQACERAYQALTKE
ncbi:DUF2514 domain-containing protein [Aquincola tertiaricarbonis]|uniref:DUF2514 domain-containing protein n=1 Tax=Aquincola tertiaricarbonis TaxID=391953 RepID=A0ABY4S5S2_AQUTE|nr:DUF2514 family protein [Aquincola tertiaricarbonis]URI08768.1 DUF2514 domain-containing protein [Aquincola tertiaricarbonis]